MTSLVASLDVNLAVVELGFDPQLNGSLRALAIQPDNKILIGGNFSLIAGQPQNRIARLNPDGTLDPGFNPVFGGSILSIDSFLLQTDRKILVGGIFSSVNGITCTNFGRLHPDGALDDTFNLAAIGTPYPSSERPSVAAMARQGDGKILVGGLFTSLGGHPRTNLARMNMDGTK